MVHVVIVLYCIQTSVLPIVQTCRTASFVASFMMIEHKFPCVNKKTNMYKKSIQKKVDFQ